MLDPLEAILVDPVGGHIGKAEPDLVESNHAILIAQRGQGTKPGVVRVHRKGRAMKKNDGGPAPSSK